MKIFVGITEVAGYHAAVAGELRKRGHEVAYVAVNPNGFGYADPGNTGFARWITKLCESLGNVRNRSIAHKLFWKLVTSAVRPILFLWALWSFDYFIFGFCTSFLPRNLDLPVLKLFGKRVLFVCHGSDSRPPYLDFSGVRNREGECRPAAETARLIKVRRDIVRRVDRHADWVIDNPFSSHFHTRPVINWYAVGVPCAVVPDAPPEPESGIAILHAPSVPLYKGSVRIAEAVKHVAGGAEGLTFVTITGKPHSEVLQAIRNCHFVIDQLYSDTPCAGFVSEAAACGRPAIVCGYGWSEEWLKITGLSEWPSLVCREEELEKAIIAMASDAGLRLRTVEAARRLAAAWSADRVAERFECILAGNAPPEWFFDPKDIPVFYSGGGLPEDIVATTVKDLVERFGLPVLQISDKPKLEEMAMELARSGRQMPAGWSFH